MRVIRLVTSRGQVFRTLVPESRRERVRGLVGRSGLADDEALLLERTRSVHTFGMRLSLSVALLDRNLVVRSVRRLEPGRIVFPRLRVRHVLECAEPADLQPGDALRIE